ncbi:isocitrate lyase/phosphoenolpyruvate mutase family protein [uncultured Shewanella sp.]|uniref:isocitrate lyase/PEP mutase family protein n=1 Tax=uncultured Shewanella sp. TaxID=173975 RepID=UPI002627C89D|nr:isocitrate lyase/phosphoenolpyruvate mutase family protein [uncultured Shewanella sp.]
MNNSKNFKNLHEQDAPLLLPNAWDALSALILEQAGFKAIGTTSWGMANSLGYKDGEIISFQACLSIVEKIMAVVSIPVTVDIESGFAKTNDEIVDNVITLANLGVVGINIEDSYKPFASHLTDSVVGGLKDTAAHAELIKSIRSGLDEAGYQDFFINARIDAYFHAKDPLQETIARGSCYIASGASGIFVPGMTQSDDIKAVTRSIAAPVNVMSLPDLTDMSQLQNLGVKRFSIGNALSDLTIAFMEHTATTLLKQNNTAALYQNPAFNTQVSTVFYTVNG